MHTHNRTSRPGTRGSGQQPPHQFYDVYAWAYLWFRKCVILSTASRALNLAQYLVAVLWSFHLIWFFYLRTIEGDRALATFSGKAMHQSKHQLAMDVYLLTFWFGMSSYCFYLILKHVDAKLVTGKCVGVLVCTRAKKWVVMSSCMAGQPHLSCSHGTKKIDFLTNVIFPSVSWTISTSGFFWNEVLRCSCANVFAGGALLRAGDNSQHVEPMQRPTRPALVRKVRLGMCDWKIMLLVPLVCARFTCSSLSLFCNMPSFHQAVSETCILICLQFAQVMQSSLNYRGTRPRAKRWCNHLSNLQFDFVWFQITILERGERGERERGGERGREGQRGRERGGGSIFLLATGWG